MIQDRIAQFFSAVFNPFIIPLIGVFMLFNSGSYLDIIQPSIKGMTLLIVFVFTLVLPIGIIPLYKKFGIISDYYMVNRRERVIPYIITLLFYTAGYIYLTKIPISRIVPLYILGAEITIVALLFITFAWKISAHMAGVGGLVGAIISLTYLLQIDLTLYFVLSILLSGIVGYSRLRLGVHTPLQVLMGFLLGNLTIISIILLNY